MRKIIIFTLSLIISLSYFSCSKPENADLAITNITLIDATCANAKSDMTVLITENKITKIGKTNKLKIASDVQIVDGSGKYLIPGLWDMHVHWYDKEYLPLFIANGVTGFRQMWGMPLHLQWRREMAEGKLLCPRLEIGSAIIDGPNPMWPGSVAIATPEEARATVRRFKEEGYDFIKFLNLLPRDAFLALADECQKLDIAFAGHFPFTVSAEEAVQTGMKSNEHMWGILHYCSTKEDEFRKELSDLIASGASWRSIIPVWDHQQSQYFETFDQNKANNLFRLLTQNSCWQCPTLTVNRTMAYLLNDDFRNDSRLKYMPLDIIDSWKPFPGLTSEIASLMEKEFNKYLEIIGPMHDAGVRFLAGTDALNPYCFPGFSLHDELVLLVQGGLTPIESLQAATRNAAEYLGTIDSLGTIEENKIADLVLLNADPLTDISNTQKINAVVYDGKLFKKTDLEKMLQEIEVLANKSKKGE